MENDDELELILGTRFEGIEEARKYASALTSVARAEERAATAVTKSTEAERDRQNQLRAGEDIRPLTGPASASSGGNGGQSARSGSAFKAPMGPRERLTNLQSTLFDAYANNATTERIEDIKAQLERAQRAVAAQSEAGTESRPKIVGPNERLASVQEELKRARAEKAPESRIQDLLHHEKLAQKAVDQMTPPSQADRFAQAAYSTRFGMPGMPQGFQPLLGKSLDAVIGPAATKGLLGTFGKVAAMAAPFVAVAGAATLVTGKLIEAGEAAVQFADGATKHIQGRTDLQALLGGGAQGSARAEILSGIFGVSPDAARSFQDRISKDPYAMGEASKLGIRIEPTHLKREFGPDYLKAIKDLAKIDDDLERQMRARHLGISQEVERYRPLTDSTKAMIDATAQLSGDINDKEGQRKAAEFQASLNNFTAAKHNFDDVVGKYVSEKMKGTVDALSTLFNGTANQLSKGNLSFLDMPIVTPVGVINATGFLNKVVEGADSPGKSAYSADSPKSTGYNADKGQGALISALQENTEATKLLTKNIGAGPRASAALPNGLTGSQQLGMAIQGHALAEGALGG